MRLMGLQAVYPKRRLTVASKEHKIYPYLLRGIEVEEPDQVWSADITYIRMLRGFLCLVAVMPAWRQTGTAIRVMCLPGSYPSVWKRSFALRPLIRR